jgi:hypothetical protein
MCLPPVRALADPPKDPMRTSASTPTPSPTHTVSAAMSVPLVGLCMLFEPRFILYQSTGNNINSSTGSSIPAFASRVPLSKDAPVILSPSIRTYPSSPPNTPEASHSASTSPASSVLPQTPPDAHGVGFVKLVSADSSPVEAPVIPHSHGSTMLGKPAKAVASAAPISSAVAPKKPKTARGQFAYAMRAVW